MRGRVAVVVGRTVRGRSDVVSRCLVSICWLRVCILCVSVVTVAVAEAVTILIGLFGMWCVCVSWMMACVRSAECVWRFVLGCVVAVIEAGMDGTFNLDTCGSNGEEGDSLGFHDSFFFVKIILFLDIKFSIIYIFWLTLLRCPT